VILKLFKAATAQISNVAVHSHMSTARDFLM